MYTKIPRPRNLRAFLSLIILSLMTMFSLVLILQENLILWVFGDIFLCLVMWSWFSILHSCGHDAYFKASLLNSISGHIASFITLVPFYSWKHHHNIHHRWTGWKEKDPSANEAPDLPLEGAWLKVIDFCWRRWIPVFSLSHALTNFWNPIRMSSVLPDRKRRWQSHLSQIILVFYILTFLILAPGLFLKIYGFSMVLFLVLSDPFLLSQHIALPLYKSDGEKVRPFKDHNKFCRSITFGHLIDRFIFLNFNLHSVHHEYPTVAHYDLHKLDYTPEHSIRFSDWVMWSKSRPVKDLLWPGGVNGEKYA